VTSSPGLNFLAVVVAVAVLYVAVLLVADRVKKHRRGVGLTILDDRPRTLTSSPTSSGTRRSTGSRCSPTGPRTARGTGERHR
jgi:hypothetical protein